MGQVAQQDLRSDILARGRVTAEDVLRLRRMIYGVPRVAQEHADLLFDLDHGTADKAPEFADLFVEAIAEYLVNQREPLGYIDEADADWLMERISRNGRIDTATELDLVVTALDKAKRSPVRLVRFALAAVRDTVIGGSGPARRGGSHRPGVVTAADVELVRRILYAYGGDQHVAVTRAEAEVLFDINDATAEAENDPAWSDLFVKAVASCILLVSGYSVPTRQEALRRERWLDEPASVGSFFARMASGLGEVLSGYGAPGPSAPAGPRPVLAERSLTDETAQWLADRLERDARVHENERALLAFLRERHPVLHPALERLVA